MQRLLTAAAAAALVVIATVFNSLRYPAVSVQLWQASQAAHGPAIASTAPGDAAAGRSPSGESRPFGPADNDGLSIAEQKPATSPAAASSTSSPASAAAATPDRMGDFDGNVRAAGEAKPTLPADGRFSAEAPGLPHSGQQASSERAVWPNWRSEEAAPPGGDSTPTPPQPFGSMLRPSVPAGGESRPSNVPPASATALAAEHMPPAATGSTSAEHQKRPIAPSGPPTPSPPIAGAMAPRTPTPGVLTPSLPMSGAARPRLSDERSPTARPADLVPIAAPAPGDHPLPDAKPNREADPAPVAKPSTDSSSNRAAVWSPASPDSASSRRSLETTSPSSAGSLLSAAMPPPAPIPDRHRPDLVPVAPAEPMGSVAESQAAKSLQSVRRLPPVDEGTTVRTKPPTAAELPAYPSTRTP